MVRSMLNTHRRICSFLFLKRKIVANAIIVMRASRVKRSHVINPLPMEPSVAFFTHRLYISKFSAPITLCVERSARGRNRVRVMATPARSNQRVCILCHIVRRNPEAGIRFSLSYSSFPFSLARRKYSSSLSYSAVAIKVGLGRRS